MTNKHTKVLLGKTEVNTEAQILEALASNGIENVYIVTENDHTSYLILPKELYKKGKEVIQRVIMNFVKEKNR